MTEGGVADQLMSIGVAPVHIAIAPEKTETAADNWFARLNRKPVVVEDILVFSRQMYTLNKAGVPILRAFAGLEASATKPAMVDLLKDIRASLDQGRELSAAMARPLADTITDMVETIRKLGPNPLRKPELRTPNSELRNPRPETTAKNENGKNLQAVGSHTAQ